jgi:BetI-type transcriptional repressor, C-terminal
MERSFRIRSEFKKPRTTAQVAEVADDRGPFEHQLLVLIDGLSAERVLYPGRVTAARQRQMLSELLDSLRPWPS